MGTFHQMMDTNKILWYQLKQLSKTEKFLARKGQEDKNATNKNYSYLAKLNPTKYYWTHRWRVAKGHISCSLKIKKEGHDDGYTRENTMGRSENNNYWNLVWWLWEPRDKTNNKI